MCVRLYATALLVFFCFLKGEPVLCQVEVLKVKASHDELTVFKQPEMDSAGFVALAPDKTDATIELAVAAAFTTKTGSISGLYISAGKKISGAVNPHLSGTALLVDGSFQVFSNDHGKCLTQDFISKVEKAGGSLFQQLLIVKDKVAQPFKDRSLAQRRALVVFANGDRAVVQGSTNMTLGQFATDLQSIGVGSAVYTPVGDGDGGWYRDRGKIVSIGVSSAPVPVQSNWVVWKRCEARRASKPVDQWLQLLK